MATTTEEQELTKAENQTAYARRLAAVLGNGADWSFDGEMAEDPTCQGKCACGHEGLRFLFTLNHKATGRREIVGSSCMLTYPGISPEVVEGMERALDVIRERAAEARRKAAAAEREAEVSAMVAEWSDLEWKLDRLAAEWESRAGGRQVRPWEVFLRYGFADRIKGDTSATHPNAANLRLPWRKLKSAHGKKVRLRVIIERRRVAVSNLERELSKI